MVAERGGSGCAGFESVNQITRSPTEFSNAQLDRGGDLLRSIQPAPLRQAYAPKRRCLSRIQDTVTRDVRRQVFKSAFHSLSSIALALFGGFDGSRMLNSSQKIAVRI
jgi:hypothetical protein